MRHRNCKSSSILGYIQVLSESTNDWIFFDIFVVDDLIGVEGNQT